MPCLVDANVLIDIAVRDPNWLDWSRQAMADHLDDGLIVNPIIFAEFSYRYEDPESAEYALDIEAITRENLPWESAFIAGAAFRVYRARGGTRASTLPDFFIGAHALVCGYRILTRDPSGYRTYFPEVELITPETSP
ncbi:MAG: type II toxin-antitoxin system VapC family toxin [Nitratireductor sp.]|nr:type II toxin-antitoxin system VapC family toxin [Nitratireductor sp.]